MADDESFGEALARLWPVREHHKCIHRTPYSISSFPVVSADELNDIGKNE